MTREEAILHMTLRRAELEHSVGDLDEDIKAFDMAIKALEQEPCEDSISRQAVLDELEKWDWQELYLPIHFKQILDDLPSITPKTKTGQMNFKKRVELINKFKEWKAEQEREQNCHFEDLDSFLVYLMINGYMKDDKTEMSVKVTTQERILIENTAAGVRVAGELEKKFRQQGMFRGRSEDTAHIILETEYYSTIKEEDDEP